MKLDSKYFDKIRVKSGPRAKEPPAPAPCEWPGCDKPSRHRAPKGRAAEGQFYNYCTEHVQLYNKNYDYFDGMKDTDVAGFQKDAQTGHRPTWRMGESSPLNNAYANINGMRRRVRNAKDPFGMFGAGTEAAPSSIGRSLRRTEVKALQTLGLDDKATPEMAKNQYKTLVKRLHPDANGGSRDNEDTLKAVIHAYDTLRASGFC